MRKKKNGVKLDDGYDETPWMRPIAAEQIGDFYCRMCGETVPYPYDVSSIMYGSPIVVCPRCKGEHLIYGRLEPALDKRYIYRYDSKFYLKIALVSLVVAAISLILSRVYFSVTFANIICSSLFTSLFLFLMSCVCIRDAIRNEKKFHTITILKNSRIRMKDMDYVGMLIKLGYDVPKKYRPKHYKAPPLFRPKK